METDVPIPVEWMDSVNELQTEFSSNVSWEAGDVLVIDVCVKSFSSAICSVGDTNLLDRTLLFSMLVGHGLAIV